MQAYVSRILRNPETGCTKHTGSTSEKTPVNLLLKFSGTCKRPFYNNGIVEIRREQYLPDRRSGIKESSTEVNGHELRQNFPYISMCKDQFTQ